MPDLVDRAIAGHPMALERLLLVFHARLAARVERRLPHDLRAVCSTEDILQDCYADVFADIGRFSVPPGQDAGESFFRWLAAIADHRLVDNVRMLRAAKRGGGDTTGRALNAAESPDASRLLVLADLLAAQGPTPSREARVHELEAALRAAMEGLYPAYREALELRYLLGLSPGEVAQRMGRSEDAVHKLCGRALGALREAIGDAGRFLTRE